MAKYAIAGGLNNKSLTSVQEPTWYTTNSFVIPKVNNKFPIKETPSKSADKSQGTRSYLMDCSLGKMTSDEIVTKLHRALNISNTRTPIKQFEQLVDYYNRFKVPTPNDALSKGFAHVFFVRPDCNLLNNNGTKLNSQFENKANFAYAWKSSPKIVKELVSNSTAEHDFAMYLSNKSNSFSLSDEFIESATYGKTYTGYEVAYGRHNIESKSSGEFSVSFQDDRYLHLYQMNKLWVDYISMVYRGECAPKDTYIMNKILDYATSVYYIVTAEDGETIIFWSKYYGVFPTSIPSTQFAWSAGSPISQEATNYEIKYSYSFKEDFNPVSLVEFNFNAKVKNNKAYVPTYDKLLGHTGTTWVGAPYIELVTDNSEPGCPYTFKLRFTNKNMSNIYE